MPGKYVENEQTIEEPSIEVKIQMLQVELNDAYALVGKKEIQIMRQQKLMSQMDEYMGQLKAQIYELGLGENNTEEENEGEESQT